MGSDSRQRRCGGRTGLSLVASQLGREFPLQTRCINSDGRLPTQLMIVGFPRPGASGQAAMNRWREIGSRMLLYLGLIFPILMFGGP
jgi:hypothetical protein